MEKPDEPSRDLLLQAAIRMFLDRPTDGRTPDEVIAMLDERLVAEVPELGADPVIRTDLGLATAALGAALAATDADEPFRVAAVPARVLDLVRTMARRRLDVTVVLRGFQVGSRLAWQEMIRALNQEIDDPELRYDLLTLSWDRISAVIEWVTQSAVEAYTEERDVWVGGARARQAETISALLAGDEVDVDASTAILGYRLLRRHLACSFWLRDDVDDKNPEQLLERAAAQMGRGIGAGETLMYPDGTRSLSAWFTVRAGTEPARVARAQLPEGVRVAAGLVGVGPEGFERSHRQALTARAVASRSPAQPAAVLFEDIEVIAAYLDNLIAARELVDRELGALAGPGEAAERLRATALAHLRAGGNAREAAALLGTHKNTVLYRLRQIEELLGRPITDGRLKLEVALTLDEYFGALVRPA